MEEEFAIHTPNALIPVCTIGQKKAITKGDVGVNRIPDDSKKSGFRLVGDSDFDDLVGKVSYITPVPGGVGPMTIAMLMQNTLESAQKQILK